MRRHFESHLAAWPHVRDVKMYNETSGRVTWALENEIHIRDYPASLQQVLGLAEVDTPRLCSWAKSDY